MIPVKYDMWAIGVRSSLRTGNSVIVAKVTGPGYNKTYYPIWTIPTLGMDGVE